MTLKIYGIPNCDTVKKARDWLGQNNVAYDFHNYKTDGIDAARLKIWIAKIGWEKVLNRASTTFKALPEADKTNLNEARAIALMIEQPSMIKRPIFEAGETVIAGFKPDATLVKALA